MSDEPPPILDSSSAPAIVSPSPTSDEPIKDSQSGESFGKKKRHSVPIRDRNNPYLGLASPI